MCENGQVKLSVKPKFSFFIFYVFVTAQSFDSLSPSVPETVVFKTNNMDKSTRRDSNAST